MHSLKTKAGHVRSKVKSREQKENYSNCNSMISTDKFVNSTRHSLYREE